MTDSPAQFSGADEAQARERRAERGPGHVLIIVRNNVSRDARVLKEARSLSDAGYRVTVMGLRTSAVDKPVESWGACVIHRITTAGLQQTAPAGTGSRLPVGRSPRDAYSGPVGEIRHWAGRMRENRLYHAAALELRPDIVISCDLTALPAGVWLKRDLGCRLVYDAHELFTEMSGARGAVYRFLYTRTEDHFIHQADVVITVNHLIADEISRRYGVRRPEVLVNGPVQKVDAPSEVHRPVSLLYQGGYISGRGLEGIVRDAGRLRGAAVLTLQGFGPLEPTLRKIVDSGGLEDVVRFMEPCAPGEVVESAAAHDVGLVAFEPTSLNNTLASPNKLFDYMAAGLAVVASDLPFARHVLADSGVGALFDPKDVTLAIDEVVRLAGERAFLAECKRRALSAVDPYLWGNQVTVLLEAVSRGDLQ